MYGATVDNENSIFLRTQQLYREELAENVAFGTGGRLLAGPNYLPDYQEKLIQLGIPKKAIIPVQITAQLAHTHTEAEAHISYAKEQEWKKVYLVGSFVHQFRVVVNTVSIVLKNYPKLKVFSQPGFRLPWMEENTLSQTSQKRKRYQDVEDEWKRIETYHAKGDLVSAPQVLNYLNNRDQ
jgi:hypothetical protein